MKGYLAVLVGYLAGWLSAYLAINHLADCLTNWLVGLLLVIWLLSE